MTIKRALISVYNKTNIINLASFLVHQQVELISTGNTYKVLYEAGIKSEEISNYTQFPEILNGRVKTLHPKIHGGILCDREKHKSEIENLNVKSIDLVIVNLYPFCETVKKNISESETIEQIDIGGVALIRAAAKNFLFTTVISSIDHYDELKEEMVKNNNQTTLNYRKRLAREAFALTTYYDFSIYNWFLSHGKDHALPELFTLHEKKTKELRYGENPHQKAAFYGDNSLFKTIHGKELSYNNIIDIESAINIISEFEEPAAVIIKHNNPCGAAVGTDALNAYEKAFSCDKTSSFGGIVAVNREIDSNLAKKLSETFLEVIIAPSIIDESLEILQKKKNLRILLHQKCKQNNKKYQFKNIAGGFLVQENNDSKITEEEIQQVTNYNATEETKKDLIFAWKICKHVKSNAIIIAKNECTVGIGAGQMSRIDSVNIAIEKSGKKCKDAVLASDAFFPFSDSIIKSAKHGIIAIIQPGGSLRDKDVITEANSNKIAMFFTGVRCFSH